LHQLPIEALTYKVSGQDENYVIDLPHIPPIHYAPSALVLRAIANRKRTGATGDSLRLLTVAPQYERIAAKLSPEGGSLPDRSYLLASFGWGLASLGHSQGESTAVAAHFRKLAADIDALPGAPATGEKRSATESQLRPLLATRGYQFLHFAAHGVVDQRHNNLFGAIVLQQPEDPLSTLADDGLLSLHEIHALPLADCELAVLSACQTNCGPSYPLEGGSTLARAFLSAGARRVVSSMWEVDDESTSVLIDKFAANIAADLRSGKVDYAAALHNARQDLRRDERWKNPAFWAPFVLIGPAEQAAAISVAAGSAED
jgi:hypothetical protein